MLVESRRVRERRLQPQAGCNVQRLSSYPVNAAAAIRLLLPRRTRMLC